MLKVSLNTVVLKVSLNTILLNWNYSLDYHLSFKRVLGGYLSFPTFVSWTFKDYIVQIVVD